MNLSRAQLFALIPAVAGVLTIGTIGMTDASPATQARVQDLDMCMFDSVTLADEAHAKCSLSVVPSPSPGISDLDLKMDKLKQLLDSSVGATVLYGTDYTHMMMTSILPTCLSGAGTDLAGVQDWCALFATNEIFSVDQNLGQNPGGTGSALDPKAPDDLISADRLMQLVKSNRLPKNSFIPPNQPPEAGCVAIWEDTSGGADAGHGHVGIVLDVTGKTMTTVEGNTTVGNQSSSAQDSYVLVKSEAVGGAVDADKTYQGCIRPWPPTDAELPQWNASIAAVGNRYAGISQEDNTTATGQLTYNGCKTLAEKTGQKMVQNFDSQCDEFCQDFFTTYDDVERIANDITGYFDDFSPSKPASTTPAN